MWKCLKEVVPSYGLWRILQKAKVLLVSAQLPLDFFTLAQIERILTEISVMCNTPAQGGPRLLLITDVLTDAWHLCKEPLMYQRANTHRCCGYLSGWCWGCCRGCCSRAAESRVGYSQWAPSWLPACSWGWSTGCKGWWSWWGFRSCWTARAKKHNCTRYTHWSQRESKENLLLNVMCHLMRESVGLPWCQLLIIKGVAEYAAHHRDVLEEHKQPPKIYMRNTPLQRLQ